MSDPALGAGHRTTATRPSVPAMLLWQVRYSNQSFWRTPVSAFFTLVFPLVFLVILSAIYGNQVLDPATGLRLAQYTTPVFAVFGACMACYMSLASALAYARESGVLKRLRGTPLPPGVHVAARVLSSAWLAALAVALMVSAGVTFYDVSIISANVPALVLTFLVGTASWAALGLAVASVAPTPNAASAFGNASLILLSFISGIFAIGELPSWMDRVASVLPLKPFVESFTAGFDPAADAATPDWGNLALMTVWGIAGGIITWWALNREPNPARALSARGRRGRVLTDEQPAGTPEGPANGLDLTDAAGLPGGSTPTPAERASQPGKGAVITRGAPGWVALLRQQTRYAATQMLRDPMSLFFAIVFPIVLMVFFSVVYGHDAKWGGLPLPQYLAAALAMYGVATTAFVNLPGTIADQRAHGVLKRMRGTPMPPLAYLVGRVLAALVLGTLTVLLVFGVGVAFLSISLLPSAWAATLLTFVLSICCFAACGLAVVALVDGPQAVIAVTLSLLLPLSFVSDIFISVEKLPTLLNVISWASPLRHAVAAAVAASSGAALDGTFWGHLGFVTLWMVGTVLVALRFFHWEPRRSAGE